MDSTIDLSGLFSLERPSFPFLRFDKSGLIFLFQIGRQGSINQTNLIDNNSTAVINELYTIRLEVKL